MEKELANHCSIAAEVLFETTNIFKAFLPDFLGDQVRRKMLFGKKVLVDADHQDLFIVRAVEDSNLAALRQAAGGPPHEIVIQLLSGRLLKAGDLTRLRVH